MIFHHDYGEGLSQETKKLFSFWEVMEYLQVLDLRSRNILYPDHQCGSSDIWMGRAVFFFFQSATLISLGSDFCLVMSLKFPRETQLNYRILILPFLFPLLVFPPSPLHLLSSFPKPSSSPSASSLSCSFRYFSHMTIGDLYSLLFNFA